ncbi:hypothetical protein [[Micrococcus luteus] ATCC 49442]|uniref:hypothetical protein n=1 Tax=[Micrococcus luteus] ATCC 49442 TaxID=2698727 RepID=UPI0013DACEFF|nr:hypothetical protein [[Micrococcus luteus] ATCC 49442]
MGQLFAPRPAKFLEWSTHFLSAVGGRITHVSVAEVTIELAEVTEEGLSWRGKGGIDVRGLVAAQDVNDSYFDTLRQSLMTPRTADYFVVDLRSDGRKEWLTSRLYIFTYLLSRLKDVRSVVFIAARGDIRGHYLGVASCQELLQALTAAQPWLRLARFHVEKDLVHQLAETAVGAEQTYPDDLWVPPDLENRWEQMRTSQYYEDSLRIAQQFLQHIQWVQPAGTADPGPTWLRLPDKPDQPPTWEHATWITSSDLTDGILRNAVQGDRSLPDDRSWSAEERVQKAAQARGDFLALRGPDNRFERLIDRRKLLEELGEATVKP